MKTPGPEDDAHSSPTSVREGGRVQTLAADDVIIPGQRSLRRQAHAGGKRHTHGGNLK